MDNHICPFETQTHNLFLSLWDTLYFFIPCLVFKSYALYLIPIRSKNFTSLYLLLLSVTTSYSSSQHKIPEIGKYLVISVSLIIILLVLKWHRKWFGLLPCGIENQKTYHKTRSRFLQKIYIFSVKLPFLQKKLPKS